MPAHLPNPLAFSGFWKRGGPRLETIVESADVATDSCMVFIASDFGFANPERILMVFVALFAGCIDLVQVFKLHVPQRRAEG